MAIKIPTSELKGIVLGSMGAPRAWLNQVANFNSIPQGMPVGTSAVNALTDFTTYAVAKGETAIRADGGVSANTSITTVQRYVPVELYDQEIQRMDQATLDNIGAKAADAVLKAAGTTLIDAMSDLPLTQTVELGEEADTGQNNFVALSADEIHENCAVLSRAIAIIDANGGADWILAHKTAHGNIMAMSRLVTAAPQTVGFGADRQHFFNGTPLYSAKKSGTDAKFGASAKPCAFVGTNDGIAFAWMGLEIDPELTRRDNGLQTLQISITYSYGLVDQANLLCAIYNFDLT